MKTVTELTHHDAQKIIHAIQTQLEQQGKGAAIAVVDGHGELIAFLRTEGCPLPSITIAMNKAFTAARQRQPSYDVGQDSRMKDWPLTNFGDPRYVGWGGGMPIYSEGSVIGAVGVSGLPEDEDIVLATIGVAVLNDR